jgi:4-methyl-5(b-hydroxyethyl)-thiazole monophosphate biosynthesis
MSKKVLVAIADGTEEIEAVTVIDVLRRAGVFVTAASVKNLTITASRGTKIIADDLISRCRDITYDAVILPGGMPGAEHLRDCDDLVAMIDEHIKKGKLIAAICACPAVVLAHHHFIDDVQATCYPSMADKLNKPDRTDSPVVYDKNFITSKGPATAMDFAIKIIQVLLGDKTANQVAEGLLLKR